MSFAKYDPAAQRKRRIKARAASNRALARPLATPSTAVMGGSVAPVVAKVAPKIASKVRQAIRDSARGEACTIEIPGACVRDPEKTIWSHARWSWAGKGGATKAFDLNGCFACTACDAVYDGQVPLPAGISREEVDRFWMEAHLRSLVRLAERGLV